MKSKLKPYLLMSPLLIIMICIFTVCISVCVSQSLGYFPIIGLNEITLDYYKEVLSDEKFLESLLFSLNSAILSTTISVLLGILIAYLLIKDNKFSKTRSSLLNLPIILPHIVVIILITTIFSQSGLLSRILYNIGIIKEQSDFIPMVLDKNGIGVMLVYIYKGIPYVALMVFNILRNTSDKLENVAMNLGANKRQVFIYILLPLSMPTIISTFIILFAFAFSSFEIPYLIGPTSTKALSVQAYIKYSSFNLTNRPYAMVINMILTSVSFVLLLIYNKVFDKIYKYKL